MGVWGSVGLRSWSCVFFRVERELPSSTGPKRPWKHEDPTCCGSEAE